MFRGHAAFVEVMNTGDAIARLGVKVGQRHMDAWAHPHSDHERAIKGMLLALAIYADAHERAYDSPIGEDGVLGEHWKDMARAFLGMLNGEAGRFDCGTLDGCVRKLARQVGFEEREADTL